MLVSTYVRSYLHGTTGTFCTVLQVNLMEMMTTQASLTVTLNMSLMNLNSKYIVMLASLE